MKTHERVVELARQFPENGMKLLLQTPANLRDLLQLGEVAWIDELRLGQMAVDPTTYVTSAYRHVVSDLVLRVPRRKAGGRRREPLWVTILIEHQSEPDRLAMLRLLEYMVQIWKKQVQDHTEKHGSAASAKLRPVLPVVLYTGGYQWEKLGQLTDLMTGPADMDRHTPKFDPVFVNLRDLSAEKLTAAGAFGQVLRVVQCWSDRRKGFESVLGEALGHLEPLAKQARPRWLDLLMYFEALVYNRRPEAEREELSELIRASAKKNEDRLELDMAWKTMAQADREEGELRSLKRTLLQQLRVRFGELPAETVQVIEATKDINLFDRWLANFASANSLEQVGVVAAT